MTAVSFNPKTPSLPICSPLPQPQQAPANAPAPAAQSPNLLDTIGEGLWGMGNAMCNAMLGLPHVILDAVEVPLEALNNAIPLPAGADASLANPSIPGITSAASIGSAPTAQAGAPSAPSNADTTATPAGDPDRRAAIAQLYQDVLGRQPDADGLNYWLNSNQTIDQIRQAMEQSPEKQADDRVAQITQLYQDVLGRAPDAQGLMGWVNSGLTIDQVRAQIMASPEKQAELAAQSSQPTGGAAPTPTTAPASPAGIDPTRDRLPVSTADDGCDPCQVRLSLVTLYEIRRQAQRVVLLRDVLQPQLGLLTGP